MREVLRLENKYLLTNIQYSNMNNRLENLLHPDKHNGVDGYKVRSLYFDTFQDRDFHEKEDGLELRRKVRLRIYDPKADVAKLEIKQKQGAHQKKRSLTVSREDAIKLTKGDYSCLLNYEEPFAAECYGLMQSNFYRPKSIVEYKRKAYVAEENNIRITFDYDITATESSFDIFSEDLMQYPVFDRSKIIMEVKYNGFMLSYIKDLISMDSKSSLSVSKYSLSRQAGLHYVFI